MTEPIFPESLKQYPEEFAREIYIYRAVGRGPARVFYKEFEDRQKAREEPGVEVAHGFHDLVMYFAQAAAQGVIGNFTFAALLWAIKRVRQPKQEVASKGIRFDAVISRKTYDRVRRENNPGKRSRQIPTPELENKLEREYRLMVSLKKTTGRRSPKRRARKSKPSGRA
jgi:hypothetical protein